MVFGGLATRAVLCISTAAVATTGHASTFPDDLTPSLRYRVVGTIVPSCSLAKSAREVAVVGLQDQSSDTVRRTSTDLDFDLACTAPVLVSLRSANGGLKIDRSTTDTDFVDVVAYHATLDLPGASAALDCDSQSMRVAGGCDRVISDGAIDGHGRIRLQTAASNALLIAGTYRDIVTLTISPRLDGGGGEH